MFENETFYYCPDFAKNAVNPDVNTTPTRPAEPGGESNPVYIRSARQLNGLSRSPYYWNPTGGFTQKIHFLQETDVNFGTYTKNYCGITYDLMDTSTSNAYRNQPIGYPNDGGSGRPVIVNNFRNYYDGQCNKIIDYRCDSNKYRFIGLFGEVERCVIKNIVMEASNPDEDSGYVKSYYTANKGGQPVGVGALIGLAFVDKTVTESPENIPEE